MHHKPFSGRAGGAYSAPPDSVAGLRGWDPREVEGRIEGVGDEGSGPPSRPWLAKAGSK